MERERSKRTSIGTGILNQREAGRRILVKRKGEGDNAKVEVEQGSISA